MPVLQNGFMALSVLRQQMRCVFLQEVEILHELVHVCLLDALFDPVLTLSVLSFTDGLLAFSDGVLVIPLVSIGANFALQIYAASLELSNRLLGSFFSPTVHGTAVVGLRSKRFLFGVIG